MPLALAAQSSFLTDEQVARIQRLWRMGLDTAQIAKITHLTEAEVYNGRRYITPIQSVSPFAAEGEGE